MQEINDSINFAGSMLKRLPQQNYAWLFLSFGLD
jgi:hypothetical protein